MGKPGIHIFRPKQTVLFMSIVWGIFFLSFPMFLSWLFFKVKMDRSVMILLGAIGLVSLFYAYTTLSILWSMHLEISSEGISYKEPFNTIACNWPQITGAVISEKVFFLRVNHVDRAAGNNWIEFLITGHRTRDIPIHSFVQSWEKPYDWQRERILQEISIFLPGFEIEIDKK
jgi:hypothetical protein